MTSRRVVSGVRARRVASRACLATALGGAVLGCTREPTARAPNIVLITVDTLRADHLGAYGYPRSTSPNLDSFAAGGLRYARAYTHAAETAPALASLFSGFHPHEAQVTTNLVALPHSVETFVEVLADAGYETAAVVSNPVLHRESQFDQGFDWYDDEMNEAQLNRPVKERTARATVDAVEAWTALPHAEPFFLWVHFQDPHGPYLPPAPFDTAFGDDGRTPDRVLRFNDSVSGVGGIPDYQRLGDHNRYRHYVAQYDGEIAYLDQQFGRLREVLRGAGAWEDSLVIFTADHGEGMGEKDYYFAHGRFPLHGILHVPLILRWQDRCGVIEEPVRLVDLAPTILHAAGLSPVPGSRGRDLLAPELPAVAAYSETRNFRVLIDGRLALVEDRVQGTSGLFDVLTDPAYERNLASSTPPEALQELRRRLAAEDEEDRVGVEPVVRDMKEDTLHTLRALGYVRD